MPTDNFFGDKRKYFKQVFQQDDRLIDPHFLDDKAPFLNQQFNT